MESGDWTLCLQFSKEVFFFLLNRILFSKMKMSSNIYLRIHFAECAEYAHAPSPRDHIIETRMYSDTARKQCGQLSGGKLNVCFMLLFHRKFAVGIKLCKDFLVRRALSKHS